MFESMVLPKGLENALASKQSRVNTQGKGKTQGDSENPLWLSRGGTKIKQVFLKKTQMQHGFEVSGRLKCPSL